MTQFNMWATFQIVPKVSKFPDSFCLWEFLEKKNVVNQNNHASNIVADEKDNPPGLGMDYKGKQVVSLSLMAYRKCFLKLMCFSLGSNLAGAIQ